ncbi:MAG: alanine--tRNA ligase [Lachnospiraceae bacterium]|nr:alanine--tRNA ligase [Ruminococcus sp.]MCM1274251.1 alanine--tRNA ligase [Lachnospiraceae bacterium]
MKWMGLNELRESYLAFFESKGHLRMNSFPLVPPADDNSILLINAGMTPLKKYFQGIEEPPRHRMTTCQKCIRTPDIENVGKTARHGTYFEMLGNFSFGDYFKHEAIAWAWEYLTKTLEIPADRLWVTIYEQDDEAGDIWANEIGVPRDRIIKLGKADNFWEHGSGPCGPCSEIHFDRGEKYGPLESFEQAEDCDRIIEIWNNVFTQFDNDGKGNYTQLATKNIDTGMGLERLACVMQGVDNLFEVDTVKNIMGKICSIIGVNYRDDEQKDVSIRVITDHIRSTTFMVGDGILPSNEGRGYVLRRLLRRAARHGRLLGYHKAFLYEVCDTVIDENLSAYPELAEKRAYIKKIIQTEEESFAKTIDKGTEILSEMIEELKKSGEKTLKGEDVFKLHDTYGFPLDLTKEILHENGFEADEDGFAECMKIQKQTARENKKLGGGWDNAKNSELDKFTTEFVGYDTLVCDAKILALVKDGETVSECREGDEVGVIVDKTPFYAEMGGQVGDKGVISGKTSGARLEIRDTKKLGGGQFISFGTVKNGAFQVGSDVACQVDKIVRNATERNHTACHILQRALRDVLGEHVHQSGSYVDPYQCRFDFSHFKAMTPEELTEVENAVNRTIQRALPVVTEVLPIEEARKKGAMALFGEKYGDTVRVVNVGDYSVEFCGGTHLRNSSEAGLFKIVSESSVASGVRRIQAVTGTAVLSMLYDYKNIVDKTCTALKVPDPDELPRRAESLMSELRERDRKIEAMQQAAANARLGDLDAKDVNGVKVIAAAFDGTNADGLRKIGDSLADKYDCFIAVLAGTADGKSNILCKCSKSAVAKGANAGSIVREVAAAAGGKGGGKPDQAMAGVPDASKIKDALDAVLSIAQSALDN